MKILAASICLLLITTAAIAQPLTPEEEQEARRLLVVFGCRACHDFEKSGSTLAPSLDRIGRKLDEQAILKRLQRPPAKKKVPRDKFMPSYRSTPAEQLELLSRFLAGRK